MLRWIAALSAALVLSGCVTTREYVYTNDPARAGTRERIYHDDGSYSYADDGYADDGYVDNGGYSSGGTTYAPATSGSGDYYYSQPNYGYTSSYFDYPAYYSVFHNINSLWYDPYYYPSYYYGVTYFPRNYLSIGFGSHYGRGYGGYGYGFSSLYYSPYRYGWADSYYDWEPWYRNYPRYHNSSHSRPRYGSARNEAERLSSWSDSRRSYAQGGGGLPRDNRYGNDVRRNGDPTANYGNARGGQRGADYGSRTAPRQDPATRGFGVPTDVRRNASNGRDMGNSNGTPREIPSRGFGVENGGRVNNGRDASYGDSNGTPRQIPNRGFGVQGNGEPQAPRGTGYATQNEAQRIGDVRRGGGVRQQGGYDANAPRGYAPRPQVDRATSDAQGYDLPGRAAPRAVNRGNEGYSVQQPRRNVQVEDGSRGYSVPTQPQRSYAPRDNGGYVAPAQQQAPRGYSAQPAPQRTYSAPAPQQQYSAPAPQQAPRESYQAPRGSDDGGSRGDSGRGSSRDDGGVRRNGRDDR